VVVVLPERRVLYDSQPEKPAPPLDPWLEETLAGRLYQSAIHFEPGETESVFQIAVPVQDAASRPVAALCATVGTEAIISIILKVALGQTGESYLVDSRGTFLAHRDPARILTENIAQSDSFKNIFAPSRRRETYTDYRGIEVLGASRPVPGTDWSLVVEQDRDEAFASVSRLQRYIYTTTIVSALGALALAWSFAHFIVSPITRLSAAAEALAQGDFDQAMVPSRRGDEIGALYLAFAQMARQLAAREERLERRVDEREAELKEVDERLKITEQAAARSQRLAALGRLAAGVTHEIRTPLASLKLFLQSLREEVEISPELDLDYRIALEQVQRIEATISRFLNFAKPEDPVWGEVEVKELIEEALLVIMPRANQQEVLIRKRVPPDLPRLRGDRKQLAEVLLNLMVNALDACGKDDVMTVSADAESRSREGQNQEGVAITVADTGAGIAEENLDKLFDPFFTTKASGTGLGLSIVHSTVTRHGGEVTVQSASGQGTRFTVFLPFPRPGAGED
jgi:signal transduction histidine kinase